MQINPPKSSNSQKLTVNHLRLITSPDLVSPTNSECKYWQSSHRSSVLRSADLECLNSSKVTRATCLAVAKKNYGQPVV